MTAQRYRGRRFIDLAYSPSVDGYIFVFADGAISPIVVMLPESDIANDQVTYWGLTHTVSGQEGLNGGDISTDGLLEIVGGEGTSIQKPTTHQYQQTTIAGWTKRWIRSTSGFGSSGSAATGVAFRFDPANNNYGVFMQSNGLHLFTRTTPGVAGAWTYLGRTTYFDSFDTTFMSTSGCGLAYSATGAYLAAGRTATPNPRLRIYRRVSATSYVQATITGSGGTQNHNAVAFTSATQLAAGVSATPYILFYENTGTDTWAYTKGIDTDNPGLVGGDLRNAVNTLVVNAAGTAMLAGVSTITAPGKGHAYFTGSGDTWTYYGQLPSAPTTVILRAQFTPDGKYLLVGFTGNGIHVWNVSTPASPSYVGSLLYAAGLQNGGELLSNDASPDTWLIGSTSQTFEEGKTSIDTTITALAPTHWWKCSEFGDQSVDELRVVVPNYGSLRGGPTFSNTTVSAANVTTRVAGPISGSYGITVAASAAGLTTVTSNDANQMDPYASGTFAFFYKGTGSTLTFKSLFMVGASNSGASIGIGLYDGKPAVQLNNSGAVASGRQLYYASDAINDDAWHLVVIRQAADGTGPTFSIDGVSSAANQNPGATWTNTTNDDLWFSSTTSANQQLLADSVAPVALAATCCHFFHMSTQMSAGEEAGLVTAAGL